MWWGGSTSSLALVAGACQRTAALKHCSMLACRTATAVFPEVCGVWSRRPARSWRARYRVGIAISVKRQSHGHGATVMYR